MGSGFSLLFSATFPSPAATSSLGDLPESCIALILKNLDPPDIFRLAVLNQAFRDALSADFVWDSKLPSNYKCLIERVFGDFDSKLCKRDLYSMLCKNNSFDGGNKKFWMDKRSGKICLSISSNGLSIIGVDDRRYWRRIPTNESRSAIFQNKTIKTIITLHHLANFELRFFTFSIHRFCSIAYLQQIWWFEVNGELKFPFPAGTYSMFFRLQLGRASKSFGRRFCDTDRVHGWDKKPVRFMFTTSSGQSSVLECHLNEPGKWIHHHVGDFTVEDSNELSKIKFSMTQIDCTHTKGGLCVDSVVIYPKEFRGRLKNS